MDKFGTIRKILFGTLVSIVLFAGGCGVCYSVYSYPKVFKVDAVLEKDVDIKPNENIAIIFSEPVIPSSVEHALKISPDTEIICEWNNGNRRLDISPKKYWSVQDNYVINITGAKSLMFTKVDLQLSFSTIPYPSVASFFPAQGEKGVDVDIEDPIIVNFNDLLADFSVKFAIDPKSELTYDQDIEKKRIRLMPSAELEKGRKYTIKIYIKYRQETDKEYRKIYETFFETAAPLPPLQWDKDPTIKLEQAKIYTQSKITEGKYIDINLTQQVMVIFENGKALDAFLVSSGKRGMETPVGDFQIRNKADRPWSKKYALFMPNWMAFVPSGEFGIHELPEWPGGYKEGANHLGIPVSHGCVRLGVGPAKRVYDWAEIGTPVIIHQ